MKVLEVDQWTTIEKMSDIDFEDPNLKEIVYNNSNALLGKKFQIKTVDETDMPDKGLTWYIKGNNGKCELWKANHYTKAKIPWLKFLVSPMFWKLLMLDGFEKNESNGR